VPNHHKHKTDSLSSPEQIKIVTVFPISPRTRRTQRRTLIFQNKELNQIEANSLQFSEIHIRIFIIESVELQFKHKSEEIVRSQLEEERRGEIEARSNQSCTRAE
jgi:hypothetical protein